AVGGQTGATTYTNVVEEYDPVADSWHTVGSMPTARTGFGLALGPNQQLFAIGGYNGNPLSTAQGGKLTELPSASARGPYPSVPMGGSVTLNGSGSDPEGSALDFAWDLDGDQIYETAGQNPTVSTSGLAPGTHTVRVRAADSRGGYGLASTTLTVTGPV